jgi:hypothetical protein
LLPELLSLRLSLLKGTLGRAVSQGKLVQNSGTEGAQSGHGPPLYNKNLKRGLRVSTRTGCHYNVCSMAKPYVWPMVDFLTGRVVLNLYNVWRKPILANEQSFFVVTAGLIRQNLHTAPIAALTPASDGEQHTSTSLSGYRTVRPQAATVPAPPLFRTRSTRTPPSAGTASATISKGCPGVIFGSSFPAHTSNTLIVSAAV